MIGLISHPSYPLRSQDKEALLEVLRTFQIDNQILEDHETCFITGSDLFKDVAQAFQKKDTTHDVHRYVSRATKDHYPLAIRSLPEGRGVLFSSHSGLLMRSRLVTPCLLPTSRAALLQKGRVRQQGESLFGFVQTLQPGEVACFEGEKVSIQKEEALVFEHKGVFGTLPQQIRSLPPKRDTLGLFWAHQELPQGLLEKLSSSYQDLKSYHLFFPDIEKEPLFAPWEDEMEGRLCHEVVPFTAKDFWRLMPQIAYACDELVCDPNLLGVYKVGQAVAKENRHLMIPEQDMYEPWSYPSKGYVGRLGRTTYHLDEWHEDIPLGAVQTRCWRKEGVRKVLFAQGVQVCELPFSREASSKSKSPPLDTLLKVWIQEKNHRLASLMARQDCILEIMPKEQIKDLFVQNDKKSLFVAWELIFYALWHQIYIQGRDPIPDTLAMLARP